MKASDFPALPEDDCQCQFCREVTFMDAAIERADPAELTTLLNYFADAFWNMEGDLDTAKATIATFRSAVPSLCQCSQCRDIVKEFTDGDPATRVPPES